MPLNAIDYSKGIIYTIIHNTNPTLNYVGSTTSFKDRKATHKYKTINNKQGHLYNLIRDNGGWDSFIMKPYKLFPCNNNLELTIEEEKCRLELKASLNKYQCHITKDEYLEKQKTWSKTFRDNHIEEEKIRSKEKYEKTKHLIELKNSQLIICECGCSIRKDSKLKHCKTNKHLRLLEII